MNKLKQTLEKALKSESAFFDSELGELNYTKIKDSADKIDEKLITLLAENKDLKAKFFTKIKDVYVFNIQDFKFFLDESKVDNSYTQYANKIGLSDNIGLLENRSEVVLDFPFKDCVLEGGQSTEEGTDTYFEYSEKNGKYEEKNGKRDEVFFNQVLAHSEIDRLFDRKALVNWKRFTKDIKKDGEAVKEIKRDKTGLIQENLIIKGNNLLALHSLKTEFAGKIKLIYIDPPYNTGNDSFNYNDNFNHSTWLIFMKNRLEVAKELLRDDGAIFVQSDDGEQAYLKVLLDNIFGRNNFVNTISARMKNIAGASGGGEDKRLKKNVEFINIFAKNYNQLNLKNIYEYTEIEKLILSYKEQGISWKYTSVIVDSGKKEYLKSTKDGDGNEIKIYKRLKPVFKSISQISKDEKISEKEVYHKYIDKIFTTAMPQSSIRSRVFDALKDDKFDFISIEYIPRSGKNKGVIYEQFYKGDKLRLLTWLKDVTENIGNDIFKKDLQGTLWDGFNLNNLSKEGETVFESGKKPEELVRRIIDISTEEKDIVLDYHLGSGTTCAVAQKMNRQYIGIEQMDYIETIAVERIKNATQGEQGGISKDVSWQGGGEFLYCELAKWNEKAKEEIQNAKDLPALVKLFDTLYERYFLNYNVKIKDFKEKITKEEEFKKLTLAQQKKMFLTMLDLNQMYVQESEMADKKYGISSEDQKLTKAFYSKK